jgi:hypothetical protein
MKTIHNATVSGVTPIPIQKPTDTEIDKLQARIELLEHDLILLLAERTRYRKTLDVISKLGSPFGQHAANEALRVDWDMDKARKELLG